MIKRKASNFFATLVAILIFLNSFSEEIASPFNKRKVRDTISNYSFVVSGHFHGASTNISTYPASSLLANIDTLNALQPAFLMSLGDLFLDVKESDIAHYQRSLFSKLRMPLFNAVGNHDLSGDLYESYFGPTFFEIKIGSELFIVLNTEINDGSIKGEQLEFIKNVLSVDSLKSIKNVFVFSHRPVWSESKEKYKMLFLGNTRTAIGTNNFEKEIEPLLKSVAKSKNIIWISGSMGGGPASFFYDRDETTNITFMQTAIRDLPRDAVLKVNVNNGKITFEGISFTGQQLNSIESYNLDYWNKTIAPEQAFNFRLLPLLILQMLSHYYFWIGFVSSLILLLILSFTIKQWRKRK